MTSHTTHDYGAALLNKITQLERQNSMSLAQKIILAETGTVEQALSIITGAAIRVKVKSQSGRSIITREVVLAAGDTGLPLISAKSKIYCKNLPERLVRQLRQKKSGIGTLILRSRLETFRQITKMGVNENGKPYRVYRIMHGGKTAFVIREDILL
ncbi:MAG: chorismate pyruvate-lyase family protein [Nitrososphaera sp.]|jgi:chorismate-pyruvate lyase